MKNRLDIIYRDAAAVCQRVNFSWLEGKTVLVTGATGLLGTHFLACLSHLNIRGMKIKTFAVCHSEPADYTEEIARWGDIHLVDKAPFKADAIIHAAGYAQPPVFIKNPIETIRLNTSWTHELLQQLRLNGKFLFVSSSEVYNGCQDNIVTEDSIGATTPYHPRACYIEGKRCGEAIVHNYQSTLYDTKSARLGLTYGPGTRHKDQRAMCQFIRQALFAHRIDMTYSGKEPRSFCYIQDAIEILWNILLHGTRPVYNVGSPVIASISDVVGQIAKFTGAELWGSVQKAELPGSNAVRMYTYRADTDFNKSSYIGLEEGLHNTIDWYRGFYGV